MGVTRTGCRLRSIAPLERETESQRDRERQRGRERQRDRERQRERGGGGGRERGREQTNRKEPCFITRRVKRQAATMRPRLRARTKGEGVHCCSGVVNAKPLWHVCVQRRTLCEEGRWLVKEVHTERSSTVVQSSLRAQCWPRAAGQW
jgi:hypothetical protein